MRAAHLLLLSFALLLACPGDITVIERDDDDATEVPYEGDEAGECSDGADNDQDGLFDCEDEGCVGSPDCACDDTDGDGVCDEDDECEGEDDTLDSDGDGVPDCLDGCPGDDDTLDSDGDGVPDCLDPCPQDDPDDTDGDGVCDADDVCPGADDTLDTDGDGVVDCLDPCPQDNPDDTDGDGVCDADDLCPGGDDTVDLDGDGVIDDCAQCLGSSGWSQPDTDGDGLPDDCLLSVLVEDGDSYVSDNIETELLSRGWSVTYASSAAIAAMTDFSAYDVVALTFPGSSQPNVFAANDLDLVGLLIHRGGNATMTGSGLGTGSFYQSGDCTVDDNTHFVTQTLPLGALDVSYTYKTIVDGVSGSATTLVSCTSPSLVVHPTLRRLTTVYYGHDDGMPWSTVADTLDVRSYAWAAGFGP